MTLMVKKFLNAVVLLSGDGETRVAHDLIKEAETAEHNKIERKRLDEKEKGDYDNFIKSCSEWILNHALDAGGDSMDLDDEILLDSGFTTDFKDSKTKKETKNKTSDILIPIHKHKNEGGVININNKKNKRYVRNKNSIPFRIQGKMINLSTYQVNLQTDKKMKKSILEVSIDTGQDPSCNAEITPDYIAVKDAVYLHASTENQCQVYDGKTILSELKEKESLLINLTFSKPLPEGISLKIDLIEIDEKNII